jgi:transposase-like protein
MAERRRYTKRTKLAAVMAAEMSGLTQASEQLGIPKGTIQYWMDDPYFTQVRTKTREDLADEVKVVAHLAWQSVATSLRNGTMEPRDAIFAAEKASSLQILMSGGATARTETRDISGTLDDADVRDAIRAATDYVAAGAGRTTPPAEDAPEG